MGCGASRLDPDNEGVPSRLRPILRRRLDEILVMARRNANPTNGLSKKELLDGTNDHSCTGSHESGSPDRSFHNTQDCPPMPQKISVDPPLAKEDDVLTPKAVVETPHSSDKGTIGNQEREEAKGSLVDEEEEACADRMLSPGSPSFRVYCTSCDAQDFEALTDAIEDHVEESHTEVHRANSSSDSESVSSNEVSVRRAPPKKGRGRRFKKMMPKGIKMQSFYNFPCSSQQNSHLPQKAAAA